LSRRVNEWGGGWGGARAAGVAGGGPSSPPPPPITPSIPSVSPVAGLTPAQCAFPSGCVDGDWRSVGAHLSMALYSSGRNNGGRAGSEISRTPTTHPHTHPHTHTPVALATTAAGGLRMTYHPPSHTPVAIVTTVLRWLPCAYTGIGALSWEGYGGGKRGLCRPALTPPTPHTPTCHLLNRHPCASKSRRGMTCRARRHHQPDISCPHPPNPPRRCHGLTPHRPAEERGSA
jgi:hypothetical protein